MNRKEITRVIKAEAEAQDIKMTLAQAGCILEAILESFATSLNQGDSVKLSNFGSFDVKNRKACQKSHPQNPGQMIDVAAKRVVRFKPYSALSASISN
jgi:nucleoid DNA-binding protein